MTLALKGRTEIRVVSFNVIRVTFTRIVATNSVFYDLSNYEITPVTSGAEALTVKALRGIPEGVSSTETVDLVISRPDANSIYQLTISNLRTPDDEEIQPFIGNFQARAAKVDSMLAGVSGMYNKDPGSNMAEIFTAIALEDERIGGQGDLGKLPDEEEDVAETYGSGTFGSSTYSPA